MWGIMTVIEKTHPELIGLFTTALTEVRGDDMKGILKQFHDAHPEVHIPVVFASTPDYKGQHGGRVCGGGGKPDAADLPEAGEVDPCGR
jgi:nitrogenase molybdenum-iron protein alpha/beta subunit